MSMPAPKPTPRTPTIREELNAKGIDIHPFHRGGGVELAARLLGTTPTALKRRYYYDDKPPAMPPPRMVVGSTAMIGGVRVRLTAASLVEVYRWCLEHKIRLGHKNTRLIDPRRKTSSRSVRVLSLWNKI